MDLYILSIIIVCLVFSALFSGVEMAFVTTNKLHIELQGKQGSFSAKVLSKFVRNQSNFIVTALIGNNLTLVIYGIFMARLLSPLWWEQIVPSIFINDFVVLLLQTIISTLIVLFTAEYIPKSIFKLNPYRSLEILCIPILIIYSILSPVVFIIGRASKFFLKNILGLPHSDYLPNFGLTDLNHYIEKIEADHSEENEQEVDTKFFKNALEFKAVKIRECMIPRTEMIAVDVNDPIEELTKQFIDSGHSKIIVYNESIDDVIGFCHSVEMFNKPTVIKDIINKITIVPEAMAANKLLVQLINDRKTLALVVDEYGGTSGIVSIEDIIEEIFGEIHDEHDEDNLLEEQVNPMEYIFSARQEIDYINETYGCQLPAGDFDTLGGLILSVNENLPKEGQVIDFNQFSIKILQMEEARIGKVQLKISPTSNDD